MAVLVTSLLLGFALLSAEVSADCYENAECGCIPRVQDGGHFPQHPLSWREFDSLIVEGQSLEYLEVYHLKPSGILPTLSKTIYQWMKTADGGYMSYAAGLNSTDSCIDELTTYTRDDTMRYNVRLNFMKEQNAYVSTLISTCPSRYLIHWMCPASRLIDNYCFGGLEISVAAPKGPENFPWQLVSKDLCSNSLPNLDDKRWFFTHTGSQCELPPSTM